VRNKEELQYEIDTQGEIFDKQKRVVKKTPQKALNDNKE